MKSNDERYNAILNALEVIEQEAPKRSDVKKIKNMVVDKSGYNERHFDSLFTDVMGKSLYKFTKEMKYSSAFKEYSSEYSSEHSSSKKKLRQKDSYCGIDNFAFNFKRNYGLTLNEALAEGGTVMEKNVSKEELKEIKKRLDESAFVDSFEFEEGNIKLNVNGAALLLFAFTQKTYICRKELFCEMKKVGRDSKKLMLMLVDAAQKNSENEAFVLPTEIELDVDEIARTFEQLECYNLTSPYTMGDFCYFTCQTPDLFSEFRELIYAYIIHIEFQFYSGPGTPRRFDQMVEAYKKCGIAPSIPSLARLAGWSEDKVIKILWEMLKNGIARLNVPGVN